MSHDESKNLSVSWGTDSTNEGERTLHDRGRVPLVASESHPTPPEGEPFAEPTPFDASVGQPFELTGKPAVDALTLATPMPTDLIRRPAIEPEKHPLPGNEDQLPSRSVSETDERPLPLPFTEKRSASHTMWVPPTLSDSDDTEQEAHLIPAKATSDPDATHFYRRQKKSSSETHVLDDAAKKAVQIAKKTAEDDLIDTIDHAPPETPMSVLLMSEDFTRDLGPMRFGHVPIFHLEMEVSEPRSTLLLLPEDTRIEEPVIVGEIDIANRQIELRTYSITAIEHQKQSQRPLQLLEPEHARMVDALRQFARQQNLKIRWMNVEKDPHAEARQSLPWSLRILILSAIVAIGLGIILSYGS